MPKISIKKQSDKTLEDYNKAIDDAKTQEEIDAVVDEVKALPQKEEEKSEEAANAEEKHLNLKKTLQKQKI